MNIVLNAEAQIVGSDTYSLKNCNFQELYTLATETQVERMLIILE